MSHSIRSYLFTNLLLSVLLTMAIAVVVNLSAFHITFQEALRFRLLNVVSFVKFFFLENTNLSLQEKLQATYNFESALLTKYQNDINFLSLLSTLDIAPLQIYETKTGKMIFRSEHAPLESFFQEKPGFNRFELQGNVGLNFTYVDPTLGYTLVSFQNFKTTNVLETRLAKTFIITMLLAFPCLGIFIWMIVNNGLSSLSQVTNEVKKRLPNNLSPVDAEKVPKEIQTLIVELNNLFNKLQETFTREKRFAADAAHELKTPLAALKIQAQVALNSNDQKELATALNNIIKSVDRSTHVINQMLILSRTLPEASVKIERVSLNKESAQVIADLLPFAQRKNIEMELIAPDTPPMVIMGNHVTIGVLIKNLVDNAIRYTPENGLVQILLENTPTNVVLKVVDNGPGVPEELREKVFERFFRVLGTTQPGCGLGLNIVRQIAQQHNAEIKLATPASGKGLEIIVTFPKLK